MLRFNLIYIKRVMCSFLSNLIIGGFVLLAYTLGKNLEFYTDKYNILIYLSVLSMIALPIIDYIISLYFNRFSHEYIILDSNKMRIRSTSMFKNSGTQEKIINSEEIDIVEVKYQNILCLEELVVRYEHSRLSIYKKDFKNRDFKTIKNYLLNKS